MKENGDVQFHDLFNPKQPRSDQELIEYRLDICKQCPFFDAKTVRCKKCGCFMRLKSTLQKAKCPIGKW
jgi:hypothetical protein